MQAPTMYPYQPLMRYFFGTPHESGVRQIATWIQKTSPAAYKAVLSNRPELFDGPHVVTSGLMGMSGMQGFGDTAAEPANPITQWGNSLLDLAKGYMAYDAQRDILKLNIARVEKGLPPVDSSTLAPTMNIGVSPQIQTLGMLAVGGLIIVGLISAFKR